MRYTESCPSGRRCGTRNAVLRFPFCPPENRCFTRDLPGSNFSGIQHILHTFLAFFLQLNTRRRIEVVITSSTRNRVVGDEPARGFDSHRLRQGSASRFSACRFPYFLITNLISEYQPESVKCHSSFQRIPLSIDNPNARKCWPLCRYRCARAIFVRY